MQNYSSLWCTEDLECMYDSWETPVYFQVYESLTPFVSDVGFNHGGPYCRQSLWDAAHGMSTIGPMMIRHRSRMMVTSIDAPNASTVTCGKVHRAFGSSSILQVISFINQIKALQEHYRIFWSWPNLVMLLFIIQVTNRSFQLTPHLLFGLAR